ncbi:pyridoxamine 5'-phosphate oxidase [Wolbachia pipientis]|uniref:Pyridoxamine 5'-phosphate oxidase n=1 Tax=Wolbachia pipientis TaxID=955 RepID=A0A1E7QJ78_WOLPI|nr:pyridoxamine 5'-phosphate oxidase [Wolbachia pipientis]OEY86520.1 pyridoxamine 5'-phosphate oxidase [Wolbachia pipientis]
MIDPIGLFSQWYRASLCIEPAAMTLATCNKDCIPSARVVLLKEYSDKGFIFFTNINSRKGKELIKNPKAALVFNWIASSRQVRVEGDVGLLDSDKTDKYYASRPRESQISAWCSKQSSVLNDWQDFEQEIKIKNMEFLDKKIPRPSSWVGFCVIPKVIEFWQAGEHRRHIRHVYTFKNNKWKVEQLYP